MARENEARIIKLQYLFILQVNDTFLPLGLTSHEGKKEQVQT